MEKPNKNEPESRKKYPFRMAPTLATLLEKAARLTRQSQNSILEDALAHAMGLSSAEAKIRIGAVRRAVGNHGTHDASMAAIKREEEELREY